MAEKMTRKKKEWQQLKTKNTFSYTNPPAGFR
jgi:hypothetical protein